MAAGADGTITIDTELDSTGFKRGTQRMQQATDNLTQTVNGFGERMRQGLGGLVSTLRAAGQQAGAAMQAVSDASGFERSLTGVQRQVMSLQGRFQRLGDAAALGFKTDAQMQRFSLQVGHAQERLQQVREQMTQLGAQRINTAEYDRLTAEMEKVEAVLDRLTQRKDTEHALGVDEESRAYQRLLIQITQAEAEYGRLRDARDALTANGQSYTTGADNAAYQQTTAMLEQMAANLQHFQELASGFNAAAQPAGESTRALEGLDREMKEKPKDASLASRAFSGLGKAISAIGRGAGRAISGLKNLGKHSGQSALTSNGLVKALTGVKRMLLTRIKRTFISALFNSLKAGMNSFARYSSAFNAAMSSMKNSTTGLSGNIAVFAGNLINALAPAISAIIDWVSKAVAALNGLFALLSGKGTFTVAKKGTDDYAKSLKGAGGAAKDLKNQVYGFDELNKEQDNSSGGGGSSGGNVDFEEKDISTLPESIRNFGQAIKEAFLAGEFEQVGATVASALNSVLTRVDNWITTKFRPEATKWAAIVARIMNGFVSGFDWSSLGQTMASAFNTITHTLNTFLTKCDFDALARGFGNGINGLFKNVDWAVLGQTVGNGISNLKNLIWGTLASIDWKTLGSGLATGVNNMFASIDFAKYAQNVSASLKGLLDGIGQFLVDTDWQAIGNDIATFIANIDWNGLVDSLMFGIGAALASIGELIWGIIETAWNGVVTWWNEAMEKNGGDVIATLLDAIVSALSGIGQWCLDHIITPLLSGIESALGLEQGTIAATATQLWNDFTSWIEQAWNDVSGAVSEFFTGVWDAIVGFFGNLGDTAKGIWDGFVDGISTAWDNIKNTVSDFFTNIWKSITGFFSNLGDTAKGIWDGFVDGISTAWDNIKNTVSDFFTNIWSSITGFFGNLGDTAKGIWDGFTSGVSSTWEGIKDKVGGVVSGAWDGIKGAFGTLSETASNIWDGFSTAVSSAWDKVSGPVIDVFSGAWDSIKGAFSGIAEFATNLWQGLKNGLSDAWTNLKDTILKPFKDFWNEVKKFFGIASPSTKAASVGDFILQGLGQGLLDGVQAVLDIVADVFGRIWDAIKRIFGFGGGESEEQKSAKDAGKDIMTGLKDGITGDENTVKEAVKNAAQNALKTLREQLGIASSGSASTETKKYGEGIVTGLKDGIEAKGVKATFTNAANKVWNAVKDALNGSFGTSGENSSASKTKYVGQGVALGVNDGINDKGKKGTFTAAADATIKAVKDAINTAFGISSEGSAATKAKYAGNSAVLGLRDGITEKAVASTFTSAANTVQSAVSSALATALGVSGGGFLQGAASASKFKDVGKAICQGAADGINANTSIIKNAAENAAAAALAAAKRKLGINSPSKAFAEIGEYSMLGLESGLKDGQSDVARTMANITDSMVNGFSEVPSIDLSADSMVNGLDNVADKLGGIASIFQAIATAISSMGGLPVPAVASGRFTPYRARVEDSDAVRGSYGALADEMKRYRSDAGEDASRNYDRLTDILNVLRNMGLTIDGRSLERSMTGLNRDRIQSYGGA